MPLPLAGLTVLEFSQYLAGPYAGLRLADLGAQVIKIERPQGGDACRKLATKDLWVGDDSLLFHTINRNKKSFCADLKQPADLEHVKQLIAKADVLTHNFRPGVMEKIGLDYASVQQLNPALIYGQVSGYTDTGPWAKKPGQDLLAQSLSGVTWLTGSANDGPVPMGLAIADMLCGTHLAQGILAALVRRKRPGPKQGCGALVEASLLESMVDFQFEGFTTFLNNGRQAPERSTLANAHPLLGAPYGVYKTQDDHVAIAMGSLHTLATAIDCPAIDVSDDHAFTQRESLKQQLQHHLLKNTTAHWLARMRAHNIWCSEVLGYTQLLNHPAFKALDITLTTQRSPGQPIHTTRCPLRINGSNLKSIRPAPLLGQDTDAIREAML
ncbi:CaiB/BaiF CoA transferase family protein [Simiduia agarivorans]|uniref:L-carnitine dehydratase/bile acid-inducible protein F n=1 Tax=Simiduia agarivorans (strain DSM 21679 / JCM 13881 / BCRC 17597 / SA1) TaxID=1117647 RepID=K4KQF5_SIMAS|nr:CaiB/BaiF CoA-transferase family protein [Simiduia agarivorans]AFV00501.1 L-carnitine dehydratase/bile acid-inducible protein F [Simiduia agarivorans SA1 = DSM 21679]